jgi:hypothetical protein
MKSLRSIIGALVVISVLQSGPAVAQESGGGNQELARAAQNPVGDLISLPFQNNMQFGVGPDDRVLNVLNIQPVWPIKLNDDWNLITRTILPVMSSPFPGDDRTNGIGDLNFTGFFSPSAPGKVIWGAGPVLSFPTASDDVLGSDKYAAGISGVVLTMPGSWVVGALASQIWDVAGDDDVPDVNRFSFQYFINYNFPSGWYFTSAPIITANWEAEAGEKWTIPIGGGLGKIVKAGKVPLNINTQIFYNLEKPRGGADWEWRFQVQMMFPK